MNHGGREDREDRGEGDGHLYAAEIARQVIGFGIEVHRTVGPGLLEHVYEDCLAFELERAGLDVRKQVELSLVYEGVRLPRAYKVDILVNNEIVVEIESIEQILSLHQSQLLTYLRLSGCRVGLLMNFNNTMLKHGIRRVIL